MVEHPDVVVRLMRQFAIVPSRCSLWFAMHRGKTRHGAVVRLESVEGRHSALHANRVDASGTGPAVAVCGRLTLCMIGELSLSLSGVVFRPSSLADQGEPSFFSWEVPAQWAR